MSVVRPLPALVVREDSAENVVTPLPAADATGIDPVGPAIDPAAYEKCSAALYVYRQRGDGATHTGVVCEVAVRAFADGQVRGHEAVDRRRVEALVRHHATTTGPPALVTLLHHESDAFTQFVEEATQAEPMLDFAIPGGLQQTVWRVADGPAVERVTAELSTTHHYIADGHHRVAAALEEWQQAGRPADAGLLCVVHPMEDLRLSAFHRRVTGPLDPDALVELVSASFQVAEASAPPHPRPGSFGLYVGRRWFDVTYQGRRDDGVAGLDIAILESLVLQHLDRRTPGPGASTVEIVGSRIPIAELTQRCDLDGGALFTLAPPPLTALTALADAGAVMPPKTTSFEPKPSFGIFVRDA
jgi:uncharacterized protein (DUF1015 family)